MSAVRVALAELWGLFVEDATLTIGTLICIAFAALILPRLGASAQWRGPIFFFSVVLMLVENVYRGAGRRARATASAARAIDTTRMPRQTPATDTPPPP
jgi:hypothetical protein